VFNLVTGLYRPSAGRVLFDESDVTALPPHRLARAGIARTFQNLQVFLNMTALENVMVGRHLHIDRRFLPSLLRLPAITRSDAAAREQAKELMRSVGLDHWLDADADALPYGALRRLEIARALAAEPRLLLLDEPAAGLNAIETEEIRDLIRRIAETGVTIVLVEHDMRLVMGVSQRILVLDQGRLLAEGTPEEVRRDPRVVAAYLGAEA